MGCEESREQRGLVGPLFPFVGSSENQYMWTTFLSVNSVWPGGSAKDQMFIFILAMTSSDMLSIAVTSAEGPDSCPQLSPLHRVSR